MPKFETFLCCCFSIIFILEIVKFYSFRMIIDWPLFTFIDFCCDILPIKKHKLHTKKPIYV